MQSSTHKKRFYVAPVFTGPQGHILLSEHAGKLTLPARSLEVPSENAINGEIAILQRIYGLVIDPKKVDFQYVESLDEDGCLEVFAVAWRPVFKTPTHHGRHVRLTWRQPEELEGEEISPLLRLVLENGYQPLRQVA